MSKLSYSLRHPAGVGELLGIRVGVGDSSSLPPHGVWVQESKKRAHNATSISTPINLDLFITFESVRLPFMKFLQHSIGMSVVVINVFKEF